MKRTGIISLIGASLAAILYVAVNTLFNVSAPNVRLDVTEDGAHYFVISGIGLLSFPDYSKNCAVAASGAMDIKTMFNKFLTDHFNLFFGGGVVHYDNHSSFLLLFLIVNFGSFQTAGFVDYSLEQTYYCFGG